MVSNHENFDLLARYPITEWNGGKVQFIRPKIIHLMRGQVFKINDLTFFTMGGAASTDKAYRLEHISWWAQELPNYQEMDEGLHNLELNHNKVDYILTHTAPTAVLAEMYKNLGFYGADNFDNYLESISRTVSFKRWFFGHHHIDKYFNIFGNEYNALYDGIVEIG